MIVAQAELDQILDRKIRKRLLELPVRYASKTSESDKGALKRCPMRKGGVYRLFPPLPFERFLERAPGQPTPTHHQEPRLDPAHEGHPWVLHYGGSPSARSVLWLIGRVERWEPKPVTITVREVERQGDVWLVSFLKGEEAEIFDDSLPYLAPDGGFTSIASRQAVPGDPPYCPPFAEDLERARENARKKRLSPAEELVSKMREDAKTCREVMAGVKARNRARLILKEIGKLADELALDGGATLGASDRPARQAPVAVEDGPGPSGTAPDVRL